MRMLHQSAAIVYVNVTSVSNCLLAAIVYVNVTSVSNCLWECYIS
jgi:hypothetical protein